MDERGEGGPGPEAPSDGARESPTVGTDIGRQLDGLRAIDARTADALEGAWKALLAVIAAQASMCSDPPTIPEEHDVTTLRRLRSTSFERCLVRPLEALDEAAPARRAIASSEVYHRAQDAWIRSQPERVELTGAEVLEKARAWGSRTPWRWVARWVTEPRPVRWRELVRGKLVRASVGRDGREGGCVVALADGVRQILRVWHATRLPLDAVVDLGVSKAQMERARAGATADRRRIEASGAKALAARRDWLTTELFPGLASGLARATSGLPPRRRAGPAGPRSPLSHWRQQLDCVRDEIALARALEERTASLLGALEQMLERIAEEDAALRAELDRLTQALGRDDVRLDELRADLQRAAPSDLLDSLDRLVRAEASRLPAKIVVGARLRSRPGLGGRGRTVQPQATFLASYETSVRPAFEGLLEAADAPQRELVRELRRASDVVGFAAAAVSAGETTEEVAREAVDNAKALLDFLRDAPKERVLDGLRAAAAICRAGRDVQVELYGSWAGRRFHAARRELERGLPAVGMRLASEAADLAARAATMAKQGVSRLSRRIGWRREATSLGAHVSVRPTLPEAFVSDADRPDLPGLYRHLFRPDPLDDERLLVGRRAELGAIAEARDRWEAGHSAALIVTGERGSGKTSLINCAREGPLASLDVARGEFRDRVLSGRALRRVLAEIVGTDPDDLETRLAGAKRVVVVEEFERTFLRHIGQYEAVRAFWHLVSATTASTLWIVVVNDIAFRLLDAAVGLRQRFSHRIDAGAATPEEIERAIRVRHDLSGLRLRFEDTHPVGGLSRRLNPLRRTEDAETRFFRMIARQAGGVYRTAFNLWLGHIGGIREGLLTMQVPEVRDLSPVLSDLGLSDIFTLIALLQHGSLNPEEHAIVFQQPVEVSRTHLEELAARELVAPEPGRPGYRVRPEAMGVVQEGLFRRNLI